MILFDIMDMYKEMITVTTVIRVTHFDAHAYSVCKYIHIHLYYTHTHTHTYIGLYAMPNTHICYLAIEVELVFEEHDIFL